MWGCCSSPEGLGGPQTREQSSEWGTARRTRLLCARLRRPPRVGRTCWRGGRSRECGRAAEGQRRGRGEQARTRREVPGDEGRRSCEGRGAARRRAQTTQRASRSRGRADGPGKGGRRWSVGLLLLRLSVARVFLLLVVCGSVLLLHASLLLSCVRCVGGRSTHQARPAQSAARAVHQSTWDVNNVRLSEKQRRCGRC